MVGGKQNLGCNKPRWGGLLVSLHQQLRATKLATTIHTIASEREEKGKARTPQANPLSDLLCRMGH
jgi:hypothetical protein